MQIDPITALLQYQQAAPVAAPRQVSQAIQPENTVTQNAPQNGSLLGPAFVLAISPESRAAYETDIAGNKNGDDMSGVAGVEAPKECETCKNRKYVDGSNDPSVSFQTPAKLSPQEAMSAVAAHEGEHVRNEQLKADRDGRKVVSQSVSIHTSICPECGRVYVSGGQTKTVTVSDNKQDKPGMEQEQEREKGGKIDLFA